MTSVPQYETQNNQLNCTRSYLHSLLDDYRTDGHDYHQTKTSGEIRWDTNQISIQQHKVVMFVENNTPSY